MALIPRISMSILKRNKGTDIATFDEGKVLALSKPQDI
jgi:hypothetical protein